MYRYIMTKILEKIFTKAAEEDCLHELFTLLLTPSEQEMLENRLLIVQKLLEDKEPQRSIAASLKASISQITAGSRAIKALKPSFKKFLIKFFGIP